MLNNAQEGYMGGVNDFKSLREGGGETLDSTMQI